MNRFSFDASSRPESVILKSEKEEAVPLSLTAIINIEQPGRVALTAPKLGLIFLTVDAVAV